MVLSKELNKKYKETSYEKILISFLKKFKDFKIKYAFMGGIGFASYFHHFQRRSSDIDILIAQKGYFFLKSFLLKNNFKESREKHIIKQFKSEKYYFGIDVIVDELLLALPPSWEIIDSFSLTKALKEREKYWVKSLDKKENFFIYTVSKEWHFLFKLFPPLDAHHLHDIFYLLSTVKDQKIFLSNVERIISSENERYREYFKKKLKECQAAIKETIWFKSSKEKIQDLVLKLIKKIILVI